MACNFVVTWRKNLNITQAEAAQLIGMSLPNFCRIERGENALKKYHRYAMLWAANKFLDEQIEKTKEKKHEFTTF